MSFFVYILQNTTGRFYIGQTNNLDARLRRHNEGKVFSTKNRGHWQVIFNRPFATRSEAMMAESFLKSMKNKKALETYITQSVESR
jgi:putative endonuclease